MLERLALIALLASTPVIALAQSAAPSAPVCDGSEIRHTERTRGIGRALVRGSAAADLVAILTIPRNPDGVGTARSHLGFVAATFPIVFAGFFISNGASPGEKFWQRVVTRLKVGETRTADVRLCLHRPDFFSSGTTGEEWTYLTTRPTPLGGSLGALRLTFRDSVLRNVERTNVLHYGGVAAAGDTSTHLLDRHRGFCFPPIPVIADPFPTPMDTTAAAAAMARARADADAAAKNAAAAAAYAMCLVSDSAR